MNQEQLNTVADIYNESKREMIESGEYVGKEDPVAQTVGALLSAFSCYLYVYKDLFPDTYDTAKNVLQNITDLITLGIDIETCSAKDGEFSAKTQHLIYLGDGK